MVGEVVSVFGRERFVEDVFVLLNDSGLAAVIVFRSD